MKDDRYEVEKAVNLMFSHLAREPLYQIRWKGYLPSQDQRIHGDEIEEEVKFRFWQQEDLKPTLQRNSYHRGGTGPRKRNEALSKIQEERDRVMQGIMRTFTVRLEEPVAD